MLNLTPKHTLSLSCLSDQLMHKGKAAGIVYLSFSRRNAPVPSPKAPAREPVPAAKEEHDPTSALDSGKCVRMFVCVRVGALVCECKCVSFSLLLYLARALSSLRARSLHLCASARGKSRTENAGPASAALQA